MSDSAAELEEIRRRHVRDNGGNRIPLRMRLRPRFDDGDKVAAFEQIVDSFKRGKLPPDWARDYFIASTKNFCGMRAKSLGEAFGISDHKHHKKQHDWQMREMVWMEVGKLLDAGLPLKSSRGQQGAFDTVADQFKTKMFDCSPAKIRDIYVAAKRTHHETCLQLMVGKSRAQIEEMLRQMQAALDEPEN